MSIYNELPLIPKSISAEDKKTIDSLADDFSKVFDGSEINTAALKKILEKAKTAHVDVSVAPVLSKIAEQLGDFANRSSLLAAQHLMHNLAKVPLEEMQEKDKEEQQAFSTPGDGFKDKRPPPLETDSSSDSESEGSSVSGEDSPVPAEEDSPLSDSELDSFEVHSTRLAATAEAIAKGKRLSPKENNILRKELKDLYENFSEEEFADLTIAIANAKTMLHTIITFPSANHYQLLSQHLLKVSKAMKAVTDDLRGGFSLRLDTPHSKKQENPELFPIQSEDEGDGLRLDSPLPKKRIPA